MERDPNQWKKGICCFWKPKDWLCAAVVSFGGHLIVVFSSCDISCMQGWTVFEILKYAPLHNWKAYEEVLKVNPVLAKMMISGIVYSIGDWIGQVRRKACSHCFSSPSPSFILWYFGYCMCFNVVHVVQWAIDVNKTASAAIPLVVSLQFKKVLNILCPCIIVSLADEMKWVKGPSPGANQIFFNLSMCAESESCVSCLAVCGR